MLGKITGNKMILGAVVGIVGGLIVAVLLVVVVGVGRSAPPADAATTAAAPGAKAPAGKATPKSGAKGATVEHRFGPTYIIKDRIVNLADPGGRRYMRFSVAIEFEPHAVTSAPPHQREVGGNQLVLYVPEEDSQELQPVAGGAVDPDKQFQKDIKKYAPAMEDVVTTVLSSKTYDEIRSPEGKESAKKEIKARIQAVLGDAEHVTNVYFTDFVVQ